MGARAAPSSGETTFERQLRVARIGHSESVLALDPRVNRLLIPDAALVDEHLHVERIAVEGGGQLAVAYLPRPSTLVFDREDGTPRISYIQHAVAAVDR